MQKVTINNVKTKSGKNQKGEWELVIITGEDGAEFTSFDKKLKDLQTGDVIEIEPEITTKDGKTKINIKEYKLVSQANKVVSLSSNGKPQDQTKEYRMSCLELSCKIAGEEDNSDVILNRAEKFYRWVNSGDLQPAPHPVKAPPVQKTTNSEPGSAENGKRIFKSIGDFLSACWNEKQLNKTAVLLTLGVTDIGEVSDFTDAWSMLP